MVGMQKVTLNDDAKIHNHKHQPDLLGQQVIIKSGAF